MVLKVWNESFCSGGGVVVFLGPPDASNNVALCSIHFVCCACSGGRSSLVAGHRSVMGVAPFTGRGVGFGFGIGCGFGVGWGFGGAPLNAFGIGAGGGCGIGLGLGWGFGAAYGTKYLDSKLRFEGIDFDKLKAENLEQKRIEESSSQELN